MLDIKKIFIEHRRRAVSQAKNEHCGLYRPLAIRPFPWGFQLFPDSILYDIALFMNPPSHLSHGFEIGLLIIVVKQKLTVLWAEYNLSKLQRG